MDLELPDNFLDCFRRDFYPPLFTKGGGKAKGGGGKANKCLKGKRHVDQGFVKSYCMMKFIKSNVNFITFKPRMKS